MVARQGRTRDKQGQAGKCRAGQDGMGQGGPAEQARSPIEFGKAMAPNDHELAQQQQ